MADQAHILPGEIWKPVFGYEERYQVSNLGRVRSNELTVVRPGIRPFVHPLSNRVLKQFVHPRGYRTVHLSKDGVDRSRWVHQLVCEAFVGPSNGKPGVLHADGNPANNTPANLRWGTQAENAADAIKHGVIGAGEKHARAKLTDADIEEIRRRADAGKPLEDLAHEYGINRHYAYKIKARKVRT